MVPMAAPDQFGRWSTGFKGVPEPARSWLLWLALVERAKPVQGDTSLVGRPPTEARQ
jgi:hypothetical protein